MNKNIKVLSAKIIKGETCKISYTKKEGERTDKVTDHEPDIAIHEDMVASFNKLIPHMLIMGELSGFRLGIIIDSVVGFPAGTDEELATGVHLERENYSVTGYHINKDNEGVTLVGRKTLTTGKVLNMVLPYTRFDGSYPCIEQLEAVLEECNKEVILYLEGKQTASPQIDMFKDADKDMPETDGADHLETIAEGREIKLPSSKAKSTSKISKKGLQNTA